MSQNSSSDDAGERITPVAHQPPQSVVAEPTAASPERPFFWVAVSLIVLLLCLVILWLPSQLNQRESAVTAAAGGQGSAQSSAEQTPEESPDTAPSARVSEADAEAVLAKRQTAQRIADALQLRRAELEKLSVERWAPADYQQIEVNAERAVNYFENREFEAAATYWGKALEQANTLLGQVEAVLKTAIIDGYQALEKLNSEEAVKAFDLALAIHPENPLAQTGMRRAKNLPQILTLLSAAENHERSDQLDQAMMLYREVLKLDPQSPVAREGVVRVGEAMQDWEFRITLSTAQQALADGDLDAAEREFRKADKLKPNDAVVKEGLAEVRAERLQRRIAALKAKAEQAEAKENWSVAVSAYKTVTELDGTLGFAQSGLARSQTRLELDQRLQILVEQPQRLYSQEVLASAWYTLQDAKKIDKPGLRLQSQMDAVDAAIARARQPVTVQLNSDSSTDVVVYKVGEMGMFDQKTLRLTPGDYTVVGRREGYRDVRTTLSVRPDVGAVSLDIRCTEKI
ncbi:tetratricopeptide (TPR) repeat protein [Litorivivens lipolytica]|uniref:Tetratricopeptide (TPR) repeat protein n=1 Tax=Litorivivens lipolytica TaxID=1524264 RepID=A0A7W4W4U4_9GAMM|nr:hypothetical protein [Litorivivens lipolytica]MBB3047496.1 tetratricopeptide (TPR) repeat protein [Litorivivens lipolytica]